MTSLTRYIGKLVAEIDKVPFREGGSHEPGIRLLAAIREKITSYIQRMGAIPAQISISPSSYRRLVELKAWEGRIGNLIIGCFPLTGIETPFGEIRIVIDELLSDAAIEFA